MRVTLPLVAAAVLVAAVVALAAAPGRSLPSEHSSSPLLPAPVSGLRLVVQELRGATTQTWEADPADPARRTLLITLAHREGYGPRLALSPDGMLAAAVHLPEDRAMPDSEAELTVVRLSSGEARRVTDGLDLRGLPVWHPDGSAIAVRRWYGDAPALAVVTLDGTESGPLMWPGALHLTAVGWDARGRLLAAAMTARGVDLVAPVSGELVAHLSDGAARDFQLAPDRMTVSWLAGLNAAGAELRSVRVDQAGPGLGWTSLGRGVYGAAWQPDGRIALSGDRPGAPVRLMAANGAALDTVWSGMNGSALDVPVAAARGGWLAVRRLEGPDPLQPRAESLWLVGPLGAQRLVGDGPLEVVGWRNVP